MHGLASEQHATGEGASVSPDLPIPERLACQRHVLGRARLGDDARRVTLDLHDAAVIRGAELHRFFEHRGQHALEVERRAVDRVQHLADRGLPLERLLRLVEQPDVLDGDDRLCGKGLGEGPLALGERTVLDAAQHQDADRGILVHQRRSEGPVVVRIAGQHAAQREVRSVLGVADLDRPSVEDHPAGDG